MNIEQLEAMSCDLKKVAEKGYREHHWRYGVPVESRRQRIKRIRRWRQLPRHFPDKQEPWTNRMEREIGNQPECIVKEEMHGFTVLISKMERKIVPPYWDAMTQELPPLDTWPVVTQYNGYVRFKAKPVYERGYHGILTYVPVHGGITYAHHEKGVSTYGFDTAHVEDEKNNMVRNLEYIHFQCWLMGRCIQLAKLYEPSYLKSEDRMHRASVIEAFIRRVRKVTGQHFNLQNNFGAMINVLCGQI